MPPRSHGGLTALTSEVLRKMAFRCKKSSVCARKKTKQMKYEGDGVQVSDVLRPSQ